jgi:hypothetical protein
MLVQGIQFEYPLHYQGYCYGVFARVYYFTFCFPSARAWLGGAIVFSSCLVLSAIFSTIERNISMKERLFTKFTSYTLRFVALHTLTYAFFA